MNQIEHRSAHNRQGKVLGHLHIKIPARWPTTVERLRRQYDRHLDQVAGLVESTRCLYWAYIWQFLQWRFGRRPLRFGVLKARDITAFLEHRGVQLQSGTLHGLATALRNFLHYLHFIGCVPERLATAVVCPAPRPARRIPQTLSEAELRRFLKAFDRAQPIGRRDFAIAVCLCRLGMRAQEVALLNLEDVDNDAQTLHLRLTKTRRARVLPLPPDVAKAIRDYVRGGRPPTDSPLVFVRHRAPWGAGRRAEVVRLAMRRAYIRAGLKQRGAHILRHTLATRLHCRGIDLKAIADLLGHCSLDTTAHYARVNHGQLRRVALPWPKGRL